MAWFYVALILYSTNSTSAKLLHQYHDISMLYYLPYTGGGPWKYPWAVQEYLVSRQIWADSAHSNECRPPGIYHTILNCQRKSGGRCISIQVAPPSWSWKNQGIKVRCDMFARSEDKKCECIIQYVNVSYNNQFQLSRCSCRRQNETVFRGCCPGYLNNRILNESLKCSRMNYSAVSLSFLGCLLSTSYHHPRPRLRGGLYSELMRTQVGEIKSPFNPRT
jgi:hypothetical protein